MRALLLLVLFAASFSRADDITPEQKKALADMEVEIQKLKAAGKLADPTVTATGTATGTSVTTSTATSAAMVPEGCTRLKTGQSIVVNFSDEQSPTGVAAHYGLSRPKDDVYIVEINPHYSVGAGYDGGVPANDVNVNFHNRVSKCLKEFENTLKDPRAGKAFVIRLSDNASLPPLPISIVASGKRANSANYPSDIGCPVILHETLHLLGLPDEYPDSHPAMGESASDCRITAPDDSIMSNAREAVSLLTKMTTQFAVQMCKCDRPGDDCLLMPDHNDGKKCPAGTTFFLRNVEIGQKDSLHSLSSKEAFVLNDTLVPNGEAPPDHDSVLYPAHFRVITEPGCMDVNKDYYACARTAYLSSKDNGACPAKPDVCKYGHKWLY
jgi:hypothetical protein